MKIALVGYGKMGQIIDKIAQTRGHEIVARLNESPTLENLNNPDVVIEFSSPESAFGNIKFCLEQGFPVVCGTTGWLEKKPEIEKICIENNAAFLYGSNFSLGVNLFFALNEKLAQLMKPFNNDYDCQLEEIHHIHKLDKPSGTAITLAQDIISNSGTHIVTYRSEVDEIEIKHTAFNRNGFALGAVIASEWIIGRKGNFSVKEVLGL